MGITMNFMSEAPSSLAKPPKDKALEFIMKEAEYVEEVVR
jgi:hypothetical protein